MVQWLGLSTFTARAPVQPLVRELRSCELHDAAKKKKIVDEHLSPLHQQVINFKLCLVIFYFCNEVRTKRLG